MKKLLLILLFALCTAPVWAQRPRPKLRVEWGVVGGINIPDFSAKDSRSEIKNKLGWQVGIVTALNFGVFAVEPQVLYIRQGMRIRPDGSEEVNLKSSSIDVPVLLSLRLLHPVRIYAGPVFNVMNDNKQKSSGDLMAFGRVRSSLNYAVGVGVQVMRHMLIDVRYNGQFTAKKEVALPDGGMIDKMKSYNVAVSVGYLF